MLVLGWISEGITSAGIWITVGVYHVAAYVFELFLILASGQLLDESSYEQIITNFYLVLGIIMLFVLAFALLRGMVNPDDQKQGASTIKKVIINIVTSAIIMAVLPTIFSFMYDFQDSFILEQNTIGKFFGYGSTSNSDSPTSETNLQKVQKGAYQIVNGVYTAFFNVNLDECDSTADKQYDRLIACQSDEEADKTKEVYDKYEKETIDLITLSDTINYVNGHGVFGTYSAYAKNVDDGTIDFNFLMCLIGGALLVYVGISYCFDMALRLVKLVFYQLIAPIPIFFRIMPEGKLSGTFNQWMKITLTCYMEVYIRIFIFYFCVYLCTEMIKEGTFLGETVFNEYGIFLGLLAKAFVLMGIVTFMRQAPKLISDITGLDSGNMKLGIKDKLAAGGAFTAGAVLGGGATALARNVVSGGRNIKNKWGETKGIKGKAGLIAGAIGSTFAGGVSGAVRSGKSGMGAKSWKDMSSSVVSGAGGAEKARDKRAAYKASHGGTIRGAIAGHITDVGRNVGEFIGIGTGDTTLGYYATAAQATNSFNDLSESTYKKKQEYLDQSSVVKSLQAQLEADANMADGTPGKLTTKERYELQARFNRENASLVELQKSMATKKRDVISIAATKLSVDQKVNYSDNAEIKQAFEKAVYEGFGAKNFESFKSEQVIQKIEQDANGNDITRNIKVVTYMGKDDNGNIVEKTLNLDIDNYETNIVDAMLNGNDVNETWINKDNVIKVQDVIDKANIERQHIKSVNERKHIVNTGNRSHEKKD